jgi:hypothetical protein
MGLERPVLEHRGGLSYGRMISINGIATPQAGRFVIDTAEGGI